MFKQARPRLVFPLGKAARDRVQRMTFDPQALRAFEHAAWQRAAPVYNDSFALATAPFVEPLLEAAHVAANLTLLDVACGPGTVAAAAAARGANASGLDFSSGMIALARARHPNVTFTEGGAENLPHGDASFDAVVSNFGIHHVPDPVAALTEARRVLAPGGRVAFTVWADPSANVAWRLVFDATARHGDMSAAKAPPPGGAFNRPQDCVDTLTRAGFNHPHCAIVNKTWPLPDAEALLTALQQGTARMAALIEAQAPAAIPLIAAHIADEAEIYRSGEWLQVPIAAVLAWAEKS